MNFVAPFLWRRLEVVVGRDTCDLAELRGLLFSLTSVEPDRQRLAPLPTSPTAVRTSLHVI